MTGGFQVIKWRDQVIGDIEQFARERGERVVDIVWLVKDVNPFARKAENMIIWREERQTMPESFYNTLRIDDERKVKSITYRQPRKEVSDNEK